MTAVCPTPALKTVLPQRADAFGGRLDFRELELSDRAFLETFLARYPQRISGFTFPILFAWNPIYRYEWTTFGEGTLLISCQTEADGKRHFLQPVGQFDTATQAALLDIIGKMDYPAKLYGVSPEFVQKYPEFTSRFEIQDDPALANYIYRSGDLANLAGKFYAKKRNLIAQARNLYEWSVHPLTAENIHECMGVMEEMDETQGNQEETRKNEELAVRTTIENFARLGLKGLMIKVAGHAVAFSVFEPIGPEMAAIHIEKANREYKGLYQVINQESAKVIAGMGLPLVNREEDMGIAGLRQAKLSYGPMEIAPCYTLTFDKGVRRPVSVG